MGKRIFSIPKHPDRLWGLPRLLFDRHLLCFPQRLSGWNMKFSTYFHLVPQMRISRAITSLPLACLNDVHRDKIA
jgi:hypothetical protein